MSEHEKTINEIAKDLTLEQLIDLICFADELRREEMEVSRCNTVTTK